MSPRFKLLATPPRIKLATSPIFELPKMPRIKPATSPPQDSPRMLINSLVWTSSRFKSSLMNRRKCTVRCSPRCRRRRQQVLLKRKREIPSTGKEEELDLGIIHSLFSESRLFIGELQKQLERDRDCFLGLLRKSNEECENRFRDESAKLDELLLKYKASHVRALDDPFSKENERLKEQYEESRQAEESLVLSIAGKIDQIKEALERRDQDENVLAKMVVESANLCPGFELRLPMQDDSKVTN
ncbi:uncharacterized protein LOC115662610 [Syzygium oleosum]|uniref:uncharacterized protein LOC115662610 n=1 Tax=Syzygium oleosum TaxID=219896 RepID=UPI0024BB7029|nr:uncharacterized protein LOC115662610 [Syzygium oleosum]